MFTEIVINGTAACIAKAVRRLLSNKPDCRIARGVDPISDMRGLFSPTKGCSFHGHITAWPYRVPFAKLPDLDRSESD